MQFVHKFKVIYYADISRTTHLRKISAYRIDILSKNKVFLGWVLINASIKNLSKKPEKNRL
ncbi:hypothetical protein B2G51_12600 [Leptospira santarosai]|nr:hypothetical protein B2G51_12600 [Leptospira santarosai]OLY62085.1 hypothetical protein BV917_00515 [Leptospira santarosai serovar Guaricura]